MKNEDFLDLLENIDERYIEEALHDYDEYDSERPVKVYAGKTSVTPLKIIAPIAACLAVVAAAGFVVSNKDKFAVFANNNSSETSVSASGVSATSAAVKLPADYEFVDECKQIILDKLKEDGLYRQWNIDMFRWQVGMLDVDFDGEGEFLLYPKNGIDYPLGVRVFKKTENGAVDLGSFGLNDMVKFDKIYRAPDGSNYYYYYYGSLSGTSKWEGIRLVSFDEDTAQVKETTGLNCSILKIYSPATGHDDADNYFDANGNRISRYEFQELWKQYPNLPELSLLNIDFSSSVRKDAIKVLSNRYGISENKLSSPAWVCMDLNEDGVNEGAIMFKNLPELPDIYIFSYINQPVEIIGVLEVRGDFPKYGEYTLDYYSGVSFNSGIPLTYANDNNEHYPYYMTVETSVIDGEECTSSVNIFKVKVNDDKTVSSENVLSIGRDYANGGKTYLRSGDRDISAEEFTTEWRKYFYPDYHLEIHNVYREMMLEAGLNPNDFCYPVTEVNVPRFSFVPAPPLDAYFLRQRAMFCSAKLGDYEITLLGEQMFRDDRDTANLVYGVQTLYVTLTKNGKLLDYADITPKDSFFTEYGNGFTPVLQERVDDMFSVDEANGTVDLRLFTLNSMETTTFSIENDKLSY